MTKSKPKKLDRRIIRTRKTLANALFELMREKDFAEITITDIADKADVSRVTFYLHYGTKEELINSSLEERLGQLVQTIEVHIQQSSDGKFWKDGIYHQLVCEHIAEHVELYKVVFIQNGTASVIHKLIDFIATASSHAAQARWSAPGQPKIPFELIGRHIAGGMFSVLVWWVRNDMVYSAEKIAEMCHELVRKGTDSIMLN